MLHYLKLYEQIIDTVWPFNTGQDNRLEKVKSRRDFANGDCNRLKKVTA